MSTPTPVPTGPSIGPWLRVLVVAALAALTGCSQLATAQGPEATDEPGQTGTSPEATPTPTPDVDLFAADGPPMVDVTPQAETDGEFVVPGFCRPTQAGLRHYEDGFLLAVNFEEPVPPIDNPPPLDFGVILVMHEFDLGLFAPQVDPELGGRYTHIRQYQVRDRPSNGVARLGSGKNEPLENVNVDVQGSEIRIEVPSVGPDTDQVTEWGLRAACTLSHPVDNVYFPSTRIPPERFNRLQVSGEPS